MKFIFDFEENGKEQVDLLGGKGANLAEMTKLGLPIPFGFTITTNTCREYLKDNILPSNFENELKNAINRLEIKTGKFFGSLENPLLVSVRSGSPVSMPGMMDTVLNLGLNNETVIGLVNKTNNARFAYDSFRRFLQMFGDVVLGVDHFKFEEVIIEMKKNRNIKNDTDLTVEDLKKIVDKFQKIIKNEAGQEFSSDPFQQLMTSIKAVFRSWNLPRSKAYREIHGISNDLGTAVNIQMMVFGNTGDNSGTGVAFTRNPSNGEKEIFGDFLLNAQGEDVVAGIRTPLEICELQKFMPEVFSHFMSLQAKLEKHYRDMQDIEFTIEEGKLFLLQTRNGKRTSKSAVKIAVDMVREELITKEEAILRINTSTIDTLLHPSLDHKEKKKVLTVGIAASPGAASGQVVFNAEDAISFFENGKAVILVRHETSPEDISGMNVSKGILTACGGKASHAAVVARGMGTPCVSGAGEVVIDLKNKQCVINGTVICEGDIITIDGASGEVILGNVKTIEAKISDDFHTILKWAKEIKNLEVRANADTSQDAKIAKKFGAEGIGLCRTEHMFFEEERIFYVRKMILANNEEERRLALEKLLPFQEKDFIEIFKAMDGLPITIRLLDPPLHEFLPKNDKEIKSLADDLGKSFQEVQNRVKSLQETNPMLGHRGCRLLISYPEILEMQTKAIVRAAEKVENANPEIMIPLISSRTELLFCKKIIKKNGGWKYKIGTMIELPRACAKADKIAREADFFSFGTNDLTQMTFGFSRDDANMFLPSYIKNGILKKDPFESLDQDGVGSLIKMGVRKGRRIKSDLKISVCGEHGGDPASIEFFHKLGFTTISCSPYRIPVAIIAAAQAKLKNRK